MQESTGRPSAQHQSSALTSARRNLSYLVFPKGSSSNPEVQSIRLRTRLLLRSLHHLARFIFWRAVRYAKYVVVGGLVTAVSASALGSFVTPVGWLLAPTGMTATIVAAAVWGVGRFAAGRVRGRFVKGKKGNDKMSTEQVAKEMEGRVDADGRFRGVIGGEVGHRAVPW